MTAASAPRAGALDAAAIRRVWDDVLEVVMRSRRYAWSLLKNNAQVAAVDGNRLVLSFSSVGAKRNFTQNGVDILVQEALREVIGVDLQVVAGDADEPAPQPDAYGGSAASPRSPGSAAPSGSAVTPAPAYDVPPDVDLDDDPAEEPEAARRPADEEALELVKRDLGGTVIGEIDTR